MKVLIDNVNLDSNSGPNGFAGKLLKPLENMGIDVSWKLDKNFLPDVQLSFIMSHYKFAPIVQRLDGIYFNSKQDFESLNSPIKATYLDAESVIFQSNFNKTLTEKWFGKKESSFVIHNGTPLDEIEAISPIKHQLTDSFENVWCCASSWRPHKRLSENVRYFLEHSGENDCLIIAGENPDFKCEDPRVFYAGNLDWKTLISLFKRSKYFIHLSWLDHCPNVVVDARAAGCHIVCSSAGGTSEICGSNSTVIKEDDWDFSPVELYSPPPMDFSKIVKSKKDIDISIERAAEEYASVIAGVFNK